MSENNPTTIKVTIFHQTFNLRADSDEEYLTTLAEYVDERMRAISSIGTALDYGRIAALAALNIADELHRLRRELMEQAGRNGDQAAPPAEENPPLSYMDILERDASRRSRMAEEVTARLRERRATLDVNDKERSKEG